MYTVLFDGICNLCNASVHFIIDRDRQNKFVFASLQSPQATALLAPYHEPAAQRLDSIILIKKGRIFKKSDAALEIARDLNGLWPLLYAFKVVPTFIRDFFYDLVARNRYRIMGKGETCRIPTPELQQKFLI